MSSNQAPTPFRITQAGIDASTAANTAGLSITIISFKLGTGFGYPPQLGDTALHGDMVYSGTFAASNQMAGGLRDLIFKVPVNAGPFLFGEIGLYLTDGTLFALSTYGTLQEKSVTAVSGSANAFTVHCLLNLGVAPSVVQVITNGIGYAAEIANTGMITGPSLLLGSPNAVICYEPVFGGDVLYLSKVNDSRWMIHNFARVGVATLTGVAGGGLGISSNLFNSTVMSSSAQLGTYVVQDTLGNVRIVKTVTNSGAGGNLGLSFPLGSAAAGSLVYLYKSINLA